MVSPYEVPAEAQQARKPEPDRDRWQALQLTFDSQASSSDCADSILALHLRFVAEFGRQPRHLYVGPLIAATAISPFVIPGEQWQRIYGLQVCITDLIGPFEIVMD